MKRRRRSIVTANGLLSVGSPTCRNSEGHEVCCGTFYRTSLSRMYTRGSVRVNTWIFPGHVSSVPPYLEDIAALPCETVMFQLLASFGANTLLKRNVKFGHMLLVSFTFLNSVSSPPIVRFFFIGNSVYNFDELLPLNKCKFPHRCFVICTTGMLFSCFNAIKLNFYLICHTCHQYVLLFALRIYSMGHVAW